MNIFRHTISMRLADARNGGHGSIKKAEVYKDVENEEYRELCSRLFT